MGRIKVIQGTLEYKAASKSLENMDEILQNIPSLYSGSPKERLSSGESLLERLRSMKVMGREMSKNISKILDGVSHLKSAVQMLYDKMSIINELNPDVLYLEGTHSSSKTSVYLPVLNLTKKKGIRVIDLDKGWEPFERLEKLEKIKNIEGLVRYFQMLYTKEFQKDREPYWKKRILDTLPKEDKTVLMIVGKYHLKKPSRIERIKKYLFRKTLIGELPKLLSDEGIDLEIILEA
jgi:hypothetical protein